MSGLLRVRILGEGGGLEEWNEFVPLDDQASVYDVAVRALRGYQRDVADDPDVIHPRSLVVLVEPIPNL